MRLALSLAFALVAAAAAEPAPRAIASPILAQDEQPSLADLEADYMVLMSEADALGHGPTISRSIAMSTSRQSVLRAQMLETEQLLIQQGANVRELAEARARFASDETTGAFEDIAKEGAEEVFENAAGAGLSAGMKRVLGGLGLLLDGVESGAEWYVQYLNASDLLEALQNGAVQHRQVVDMYSVMNAELQAEIRAERRLREILPEQRRLFDRIAEARRAAEATPTPPGAARPRAGSSDRESTPGGPGVSRVEPAPSNAPICSNTYDNHREAGLPLVCRCTGPTQFLMTWGTDVYRHESTICNAAIHAGALPADGIGVVRLIPVSRAGPPVGSTRNGVSTYDFYLDIVDGFRVMRAEPGR